MQTTVSLSDRLQVLSAGYTSLSKHFAVVDVGAAGRKLFRAVAPDFSRNWDDRSNFPRPGYKMRIQQ